MLHACFTPFASCFVYTSWRFYAFSGTNLLTRCHSASFLFSAIFVFQKSYTGNILGIGQNKKPKLLFFPHEGRRPNESRRGARGQPHPRVARPLAHPAVWCGGPGPPLTPPLRLYKAFRRKTLKQSAFSPVKFHSAAAIEDQFRGTEVSVPAPCLDGEVPPEPSPSMSSPPLPSPSPSPPSPPTLQSPMMRRE
jgi:hypothetical protein